MSMIFGLPLTQPSTGRSLSSNQYITARGRIDEGFEAVAIGQSFPTTVCFAANSRVSGDHESEVARTPGPSASAALFRALTANSMASKRRPAVGAFASVGEESRS